MAQRQNHQARHDERRGAAPISRQGRQRAYEAYGLRIQSVIPLPCLALARPGPVEAKVINGSASLFSRVRSSIAIKSNGVPWFQHIRLPDGSDYLRWSGLFEFLISAEGREIACRSLDGSARETFQTYLLSQVLSFALLKRGIEPLHSTTVTVDGEAVGLIGDCGYGKSTLGAAFLQAGHRLLTDDLLVVREENHGFYAYPGPPRIKLFPEIAKSLIGDCVEGIPMNNLTPKLIIPLTRHRFHHAAAPLRTIYVLTSPVSGSRCERVTVRRLSQRRAFVELLRNTFNAIIVETERLKGQFVLAARVASKIPIKLVSYPRTLSSLPSVRDAILSDLRRD